MLTKNSLLTDGNHIGSTPGDTMEEITFSVFSALSKDDAGFTAIEYGLLAAFSLILAGELVSKF